MKNYTAIKNIFFETLLGGLSKILGILGLLFAAWRFGATKETDFVYFSTGIVFTILGLFTTINGNILLPQFILLQLEKGKDAAWQMASTFLAIALAFLSIGSIIVFFVFKYGIDYISQFKTSDDNAFGLLAVVMSITLFNSYFADFISTIFKANGNYYIPNMALSIGALFGFFSLIGTSDYIGGISIALSFLVTQTMLLIILVANLFRNKVYLRINFHGIQYLMRSFKLIPPYVIGQLSATIVILFPNYLLTGLDGGVLTAITYARRIFELVPALLVVPIISALTPHFSNMLKDGEAGQVAKKINNLISIFNSILIPVSFFVIINSPLIVNAILGWKNYSVVEQNITANAISWYFSSLFVLGSNAVITKTLAMTQNVKLAYVSLIFALAPAIGVPLFTAIGINLIGSAGVAAGYAIYLIAIHFAIGYLSVWKIFGKFEISKELMSIIRPLSYSIISGFVVLMISLPIDFDPLINLIIFFFVYISAYLAQHMLRGTYEYRFILNEIGSKKNAS